ncbi:hypothetical protein [Endozoicomonas atrinae]|uniref:hypothetical protein n=1 Tax=Endozoicomonas atrinae TaxID=1333660 RepID=UPI000825A746|nr:hypothetical protein [Endozoicomonas atrinae]
MKTTKQLKESIETKIKRAQEMKPVLDDLKSTVSWLETISRFFTVEVVGNMKKYTDDEEWMESVDEVSITIPKLKKLKTLTDELKKLEKSMKF